MNGRQEAIVEAMAQAMFHDDDPDKPTVIIACLGDPLCNRINPSSRTMERCRQCEKIVLGIEGNA